MRSRSRSAGGRDGGLAGVAPNRQPVYCRGRMKNTLLHAAGLGLGVVNTAKHRAFGYRTPRRIRSGDWAAAEEYDRAVVTAWFERAVDPLDVSGKRVLEVGPGPDLGTGALLLAKGAASYTAVDAFELATDVPAEFYGGLGVEDPAQLGYEVDSFPGLPGLSGREYDLVLSNMALEHVADVRGLFLRLGELVSSGGRMVHNIDACTHMRPLDGIDPLNVYRYAPGVYDRLLSFPGAPNRLLADDYADAARDAGFAPKIRRVLVEPESYVAAARPKLAKQFREREDIDCVHFTLDAVRA